VKALARIVFVTLSLWLSLISCSADVPLPVTFDHSHDGFSISLPSGWGKVPAESLETVNRAAATLYPDWATPVFQYAYEMTNSQAFKFPPCVWIRVSSATNYSDTNAIIADLSRSDFLPPGFDKEKVKLEKGSPVFDKDLNAVVLKTSVKLNGTNVVSGTMAYFLTQSGAIIAVFYVPPNHENEIPVDQIIRGVHIHSWAKRQPSGPPSLTGLWISLAAIAAVMLTLWCAKPAVASTPETAPAPPAQNVTNP
jgi:hypothetical protein